MTLNVVTRYLLELRARVAIARMPGIGARGGGAVSSRAASARRVGLDPYSRARLEWTERYGEYAQRVKHWRVVTLGAVLAASIACVGIIDIHVRGRLGTYLVNAGPPATVGTARIGSPGDVDPRIIKAYLARFVTDWRSVTVDRQAQKMAVDRVYAMLPSGSAAVVKLNVYFKGHNPFVLASTQSVDVAINNLLAVSDREWQVEWQEETRDSSGAVRGKSRLKVLITLGIEPPTEESLIVINPLGIYITDLRWSQPV